ncbi:MAG TPA: AbrB/MazE/SpoVT family DNA-binding domain-containing protein [Bryobacteraceae bacterium]|jgi:AbrB family looped-hinge helix DNA binding protein
MATKNTAVISRVGQRRQIVIPRRIAEELHLDAGDFVAVERRQGFLVVTPQRLVDADDALTPEEAKLLKKAEQQMRRGQSVTLGGLQHELDRTPRGRSRKTA